MTNLELISTLRKHRGHVLAGVLSKEDVRYLRIYKNDIISDLTKQPEDTDYEISYVGTDLYLDPAK